MKRGRFVAAALLCVIALASCSGQTEDVLHLGIDAIVQDIDIEKNRITVQGTDGVLGSTYEISCDEIEMIYCNYRTGEVKQISIQDLQNGDELILGVRESELSQFVKEQGSLNIEQLQLGTQRLD